MYATSHLPNYPTLAAVFNTSLRVQLYTCQKDKCKQPLAAIIDPRSIHKTALEYAYDSATPEQSQVHGITRPYFPPHFL